MPNRILYQQSSNSHASPDGLLGNQISFNQATDPQPHRLAMLNSVNSSNQDNRRKKLSNSSQNVFITDVNDEITLRVDKELQEEG